MKAASNAFAIRATAVIYGSRGGPLRCSPKEVLTGQAWRDDGLLNVYDDKGSALVRPGRVVVPWIPPVLSDRAVAGNAGASVPAPSMCTVLGQRPWWGLRLRDHSLHLPRERLAHVLSSEPSPPKGALSIGSRSEAPPERRPVRRARAKPTFGPAAALLTLARHGMLGQLDPASSPIPPTRHFPKVLTNLAKAVDEESDW